MGARNKVSEELQIGFVDRPLVVLFIFLAAQVDVIEQLLDALY